MKISFQRSILLVIALIITLFNARTSLAQSTCGNLDMQKVEALLKEAEHLEMTGDEHGSKRLLDEASQMYVVDLEQFLNKPIPDPQGQYCKPNPTTEYIGCLFKLTARVELAAAENNTGLINRAMERANEAVDLWTTKLAYSIAPVGNNLCSDYLACLYKALAQRELIGLKHSETDDLLQAKADEILKKGCNPCSVKWMAIADVDINWKRDDENVTMRGRATWENFYIMLNQSDLDNKCMSIEYDDRRTFPFACDEAVVTGKGGDFPKPVLELLDADKTFAQSMIDADIVLCCSETHDPRDLKIISYLGFDNHGEQVIIPIADKVEMIKNRKPFSVSQTVTNNDVPTYMAKFRFKFIPVW